MGPNSPISRRYIREDMVLIRGEPDRIVSLEIITFGINSLQECQSFLGEMG